MFYSEKQMEEKAIIDIASQMCVAARTAPKTRGVDNISTMVITGSEKDLLANKMLEIAEREFKGSVNFFTRDAENLKSANALVLIGVKRYYYRLKFCSYCGFANCEKCIESGGSCAFSMIDLGIALSSAALTAANNKVDNRIMYSVGKAAMEMGYKNKVMIWHGIPISISGKSIFFDRK